MVDVVKDPQTSCLINLKEQQVLISSNIARSSVCCCWNFSWVMPGSLSCISTQLWKSCPPPPPCCKKLWCSFEIREPGRHDNSVGRAEYVKPVQWGTHCKEAFYIVLHSPPDLAPKELLMCGPTFIQQITSVIFFLKAEQACEALLWPHTCSQLLEKRTVCVLWSD